MWPVFIFGTVALLPAIAAIFIKSKVWKSLLCVVSFIGFLLIAFIVGIFVLPSYIGMNGMWVTFTLSGVLFAIFILLIWKPFTFKIRRISVLSLIGACIILAAVFIAPGVYHSNVPRAGEEIYLTRYAPFGNWWYVDGVLTHHDSLVTKLNDESTLSLYGDLPRLDGATALYPVYSAFVRATYPAPEPNLDIPQYEPYGDLRDSEFGHQYLVVCSRTALAFENLIDGYADVVFLMGVSDEQREKAAERGLELILTPIGHEAFVFFVNSRNRVTGLTTDDIHRIYSGEVTNWRDVGGGNNAIRAYQRPDESGSQVMLREIMGDVPIVPAPLDDIHDMMMGMYQRVASYRNYRNSLGYSFLYYIRDMIGENRVKFLSIDGVEPTPENIASGDYPFANSFYAVTVKYSGEYFNAERTENINALLEWILSPQGQYLVETTGYVPIGKYEDSPPASS